MSKIATENTFETAIVQSLIDNGGYSAGNAPDYSLEFGVRFKRISSSNHLSKLI